jgi:hypothetical protein
MSIDLTNPIFNDEAAAWEHFEAIRWPDGQSVHTAASLTTPILLSARPRVMAFIAAARANVEGSSRPRLARFTKILMSRCINGSLPRI